MLGANQTGDLHAWNMVQFQCLLSQAYAGNTNVSLWSTVDASFTHQMWPPGQEDLLWQDGEALWRSEFVM